MKANKILFPTDFSSCSDEGLKHAVALAREAGGKLLIVHVEEPPPAYGGGEMYYGLPNPDNEELVRMLKRIQPEDKGVPFEHHLLAGDPATEIVDFAESEGVDLIVIGTHGRTGLRRLLMGSVAEQIVRRAKCPVITVKLPEHSTAEKH